MLVNNKFGPIGWRIYKHWKFIVLAVTILVISATYCLYHRFFPTDTFKDTNIFKLYNLSVKYLSGITGRQIIVIHISFWVLSLIISWIIIQAIKQCLISKLTKSLTVDYLKDKNYEIVNLCLIRCKSKVLKLKNQFTEYEVGRNIHTKDCAEFIGDIIKSTSAKKVYVTCIQTPEALFENMKEYSEGFIRDVIKYKKTLLRIIVCSKQVFDPDTISEGIVEANKWFLDLHQYQYQQQHLLKYLPLRKQPKIELRLMEMGEFYNIVSRHKTKIMTERLDILLFDKRVLYALKTDGNEDSEVCRLKTPHANHYNLMIKDKDLDDYPEFWKELWNTSHGIEDILKKEKWLEHYQERSNG